MKSNVLIPLGASCVSLLAGYLLGNNQEPSAASEKQASASHKKSYTQASAAARQSQEAKTPRKPQRSQPATAEGRANLALHKAMKMLDESNQIAMDFGLLVDLWKTFETLDSDEIRLALQGIEDKGTNQKNTVLNMLLLNRWGEVDGPAAVEYAMGQKSAGMMGSFALSGSLSSWIDSDPVAAETWYEQNKDNLKGGVFGKKAIEGMFFKALAKKDLDAAFGKIDLSKTSDRKLAIQAINELASEPDLRDRAMAKIQSLEDPKLQQKMYEGMIQNLSYQDPAAAKELLSQIDEQDPKKYLEYQKQLINGMSAYDPAKALEYISTEISDGDARSDNMQNAFASLASQDGKAAKEWLANNPSEDSDAYMIKAAENLRWQDPEQSMEWALEISDDDKRTDQAVKTYKRWKKEHESGAQAWLETQHPETQEAILEESEEE